MRQHAAILFASAALTLSVPISAQYAAAPIRVGTQAVAQPRLVKSVAPAYPAIGITARITGAVLVEATIAEDGRVSSARVLRSVPLLDPAALDAIRRWEFQPAIADGRAVPAIATITLTFRLDEAAAPVLPPGTPLSIPGISPDLAIVYRDCGRNITLDPSTPALESVYKALLDSGLLSNRAGLRTWPDPPATGTTVTNGGIEMTVAAVTPIHCGFAGGAPFWLDIRSNGRWTRLWPMDSGSTPSPDYEKQVRDLAQRIAK